MSTRQHYWDSLEQLRAEVRRMGDRVDHALSEAMIALQERDLARAERIDQEDQEVDALERVIRDRCVDLLGTQQPLARDLRLVVGTLEIIRDLERSGDHAAKIARSVKPMSGSSSGATEDAITCLTRMAVLAGKMLVLSVDAFTTGAMSLLAEISAAEAEVDALNRRLFGKVLAQMAAEPATIPSATRVLFMARFLERIADHATNIAERAAYVAGTGSYEPGTAE